MWLYAALFSACVYSLRSIVEKASLKSINKYILAFGLRFFALPLFIIPFLADKSLFIPVTHVPFQSWVAIIFITFIATPLEMIFFYKALQLSEVSRLIPLLSLAPLMTALFNSIIFRASPSIAGVAGMVCIVLSVYILNISKEKKSLLEPFHRLSSDKASRYLLIMLISYSAGVVIDKVAISGTNPYYYALVNYVLVSISLFLIAKYKAPGQFYQIRHNLKTFIILGAIVFLYTIPRNIAISGGNVGYVSSVLSVSVIISTVIGLILFREKDASIKIAASIIACAGVVILKLFG